MTGHYPSTRFRTAKKAQQITAACSCGWEHPASSHVHSNSLFVDHHVEATGHRPPEPAPPTRRTR